MNKQTEPVQETRKPEDFPPEFSDWYYATFPTVTDGLHKLLKYREWQTSEPDATPKDYVTVHIGCLDWDLSEAKRHVIRVNEAKDSTGYIKGFREGNVTGIEHAKRVLEKWRAKAASPPPARPLSEETLQQIASKISQKLYNNRSKTGINKDYYDFAEVESIIVTTLANSGLPEPTSDSVNSPSQKKWTVEDVPGHDGLAWICLGKPNIKAGSLNKQSAGHIVAAHNATLEPQSDDKGWLKDLEGIASDLRCRNDTGHYCPNCDRSLFNAKAKLDVILSAIREANTGGKE